MLHVSTRVSANKSTTICHFIPVLFESVNLFSTQTDFVAGLLRCEMLRLVCVVVITTDVIMGSLRNPPKIYVLFKKHSVSLMSITAAITVSRRKHG